MLELDGGACQSWRCVLMRVAARSGVDDMQAKAWTQMPLILKHLFFSGFHTAAVVEFCQGS